MRYFSEVTFKERVQQIENGLPVTKIYVALDDTGDNYIAHGNNTGHFSFTSKGDLVNWLGGLGVIEQIENTNPTLARLPEGLAVKA